MTKTETRALAALRFITENTEADAFTLREVATMARVRAPHNARVTDRLVADALTSLVARGLVVKTTTLGMGGGFTTYELAR